jgi:uncharacterized protein YxjI
MSRYIIREKIFALGDDFTVKDASGRNVLFVDGKVFTIRDALDVKDMEGNTVATIRRRLLSIGTTYAIERNGHTTTVHKHIFTLFRCRFSIDVPGPDDLEAKGSLFDYEYTISGSDGPVATISKAILALADHYAIDIVDGPNEAHDDILLICCCIVIDRCCHESKD